MSAIECLRKERDRIDAAIRELEAPQPLRRKDIKPGQKFRYKYDPTHVFLAITICEESLAPDRRGKLWAISLRNHAAGWPIGGPDAEVLLGDK